MGSLSVEKVQDAQLLTERLFGIGDDLMQLAALCNQIRIALLLTVWRSFNAGCQPVYLGLNVSQTLLSPCKDPPLGLLGFGLQAGELPELGSGLIDMSFHPTSARHWARMSARWMV